MNENSEEEVEGKEEIRFERHPVKDYFKCFRMGTRDIAANAIIAALYVALTYAFSFMSYGNIQVRISEFLMLLCFFNPNYIIGLTLGCLLSNIYSLTLGMAYDMIFGTLATFVSGVIMSLMHQLLFASFIPAIINGFVVGFELWWLVGFEGGWAYYWVQFGWVCLGEIIAVSVLGLIVFYPLTKKNKSFYKVINAKRNLDYKF